MVLAPLAIATVFIAPIWVFRLAVTLLMLTGCFEFRRLANLPPLAGWALFGLQSALIALMWLNWNLVSAYPMMVLSAACFTWLLMFVRLRYRDSQAAGFFYQSVSFVCALAAISFCWFALNWLHDQPHGDYLVFSLLIIIWAADVGAYFSGRQFGRTKLAPSISPSKTWEGVIGGILLAGIAALLLRSYSSLSSVGIILLLLLTAITVCSSICGDLFISIHKRTVGLKDAGRVFPGHGGVLDRFDSLLPAAPFFALGIWWLSQ